MKKRETFQEALNTGYISNMTGRPRKLSDGAMIDICTSFANGAKVKTLASQYEVSEHTIYSVVYWTPRKENKDNG